MSFFDFVSFPRPLITNCLIEPKEEILKNANKHISDMLNRLDSEKIFEYTEHGLMLSRKYGEYWYDSYRSELQPAEAFDFMGVFINPYVYHMHWQLSYFDEIQYINGTESFKEDMEPHEYSRVITKMICQEKISSYIEKQQAYILIKNNLSLGEKVEIYKIWVSGHFDDVKFMPINQVISIKLDQFLEHGLPELDDRYKVEIYL